MSRFTKQLITLAALVVVCSGLALVYFSLGAEEYPEDTEPEVPPALATTRLIEQSEDELLRATFISASGQSFTLEPRNDEADRIYWIYAGNPDIELSRSDTRNLMRDIFSFSVTDTVIESVDNPEEFGIGRAVVTGYFKDGTSHTIRIGSMTPDRNRFYAMIDGDPALYLVNTAVGNRLSQDIKDLVDRNLPLIEHMQLTHLFLKERGRTPIEFAFDGTQQEMEDSIDRFGQLQLTMVTPFPGRDLFFSNFEMFALGDFLAFNPTEVAELFPEDLSVYGMDDPLLEFIMEDAEGNGFHLIFGSYHNDEYIYVMYADRPHVFLGERRHMESLLGVNPFNFIERFVFITDIFGVERVTIQSTRGDYDMLLNHFTDENDRDQIAPLVDGQEVPDRGFRQFYQTLIGLVLEHEIEQIDNPGTPDITLTYHFIDVNEPPTVVDIFTYDLGFYAIRVRPYPVQFVTSRMSVDLIFSTLEDLLNDEP